MLNRKSFSFVELVLESKVSENKFRLVTRSDFDGLVCAVLFKDVRLKQALAGLTR